MDLLWYCAVMTCGFLADIVCVLYFEYLRFWYVSLLEQVLSISESEIDRAKSVRVSQPVPAPMD
jgi:hypothetical protein